jgi:hypothetical protein
MRGAEIDLEVEIYSTKLANEKAHEHECMKLKGELARTPLSEPFRIY